MTAIHLAGGCFWGVQDVFSRIPGVIGTECGYANGDRHYIPDYMLVCSGRMGYREAVKVEFDPSLISLEDILAVFFLIIDPTQERRQGNDIGVQYQTGVYWSDRESEDVVRRVFAAQEARYDEFHVEMGPLEYWTRAEDEHQDYLARNPTGYCHIPVWKRELVNEVMRHSRMGLSEQESDEAGPAEGDDAPSSMYRDLQGIRGRCFPPD